jgi:NADH-quinone oxidoreductase subunit G
LRETGVLPNAGPGLSDVEQDGLDAPRIAAAFASGELSCLYLLGVDPPASGGGGGGGSSSGSGGSGGGTIIAHATLLTDALRERADVVFPAETYAEKEGAVTHPDGRIQRVRRAVAHAGVTRDELGVLEYLADRLGAAVAS